MENEIVIVTDAWKPQINGVVTTIENTLTELEKMGNRVHLISYLTPGFDTFSAPRYSDVRLVSNPRKIFTLLESKFSDSNSYRFHVSTEGPLGVCAAYYFRKNKIPFTTSYHTKTPEFLKTAWAIPEAFSYAFMRRHHKGSKTVFVTTESMKLFLQTKKLHPNMVVWNRGVDSELFHPSYREQLCDSNKKILLYVGRVSKEKNMETFFKLEIPNTIKIVVGDGPQKLDYEKKNPDVRFVGFKTGKELATFYASADVFVFPSIWDTFGLVQIEAASCGTPIATVNYSVSSKDVIKNGINGYASDTLESAVYSCFDLDRETVRKFTIDNYSWRACTETFLNHLK